jgi:hypothetical protein
MKFMKQRTNLQAGFLHFSPYSVYIGLISTIRIARVSFIRTVDNDYVA